MSSFMTRALWIDFATCTVKEDVMSFPEFSGLMKADKENDIQILVYERVAVQPEPSPN